MGMISRPLSTEMTGYLHPGYAASLKEFGAPRELPQSGGWLLERSTPHPLYRDVMGCYPLFCCRNWPALASDIEKLDRGLVSVALVPDPFGDYTEQDLKHCFDRVVPFKEHYVVDLEMCGEAFGGRHHRYYAKRAFDRMEVRVAKQPAEHLNDWIRLYGCLIQRHGLKGVKAFSHEAFREQLTLPGTVLFHALQNDATIGAHIWFVQGNVAYSHLMAADAMGYELGAAYALYATAIKHFLGKVKWLNLGAGAGAATGNRDGLTKFKAGWANGTRPGYFCGRILDRQGYAALVQQTHTEDASYFPAYRSGELS